MEKLLLDILAAIRRASAEAPADCATPGTGDANGAGANGSTAAAPLDEKELAKIIHRHNKHLDAQAKPFSKKRILPYYLKVKSGDAALWQSWGIGADEERALLATLQVKPRRTASGVATITVITKPHPCSSACLYCPNDVRMPKSYLSDEPACQRAERNFFDPYLQVASRIRALTHMGHPTDKIELIVLGGTWSDYPAAYQIWFAEELFRALNDGPEAERHAARRRARYRAAGLSNDPETRAEDVREIQARIRAGETAYNAAVEELYGTEGPYREIAAWQQADIDTLLFEQKRNETAAQRVVGFVVETRPDTIDPKSLELIRRIGCTKIQMGVQTLRPEILRANHRAVDIGVVKRAFELARLFGFKIHAHFMANLYGSTPDEDIEDYRRFMEDDAWKPDEVKLYPCVLVEGTGLDARFLDGSWRPYDEDELVRVLAADAKATPPFTRISRMIRDISAHDIVAGNKKTNLRQMVEGSIEREGDAHAMREIRYRELNADEAHVDELALDVVSYETTATSERFLQWVTPQGKIAGFLRLSMPHQDYLRAHQDELPVTCGQAMIREVHVYGKTARLHDVSHGAQHLGLGKRLVETACAMAAEAGFREINVISSVGTREYYRNLGFRDEDLYLTRTLAKPEAPEA